MMAELTVVEAVRQAVASWEGVTTTTIAAGADTRFVVSAFSRGERPFAVLTATGPSQ
jgi:hypothetical protein